MTSHHAFTAQACQSAADEWAGSGNPVHEAAAPLLESWAVNAEARAALSEVEIQPDLFGGSYE
jgi:hypothetical protein